MTTTSQSKSSQAPPRGEESPSVNYCYRCGKRLGDQRMKCYYCGAPGIREIRPPRRCPFCDLPVRRKAVKCPNCGEFLDERARTKEAVEAEARAQTLEGRLLEQAGQQRPSITFIIDKAVIGAPESLRLPPGAHVPRDVSHLLPPSTVEAIERGDPTLIDHPGVKALPSPEASSGSGEIIEHKPAAQAPPKPRPGGRASAPEQTLDLRLEESAPSESSSAGHLPSISGDESRALQEYGKGGGALAKSDRSLAKREAPSNLPARQVVDRVFLPALRTAGKVGKVLVKQAVKAFKAAEAKLAEEAIDPEEARYRLCPSCSTEVFVDDSYCFHCGIALTQAAKRFVAELAKKEQGGSNAPFAISFICAAVVVWAWLAERPPLWMQVPSAVGAIAGLAGVFRSRGILRLFCLAIAVLLGFALWHSLGQ